ncbi:MAG: hypothetical protein AAGI01_15415 [Myxococcota bacterium]
MIERCTLDIFAELRSVLHGPPSEARFETACALIEHAPEADRAGRLVPYAVDHMSLWAPSLRRLPDLSITRLADGERLGALALLATYARIERGDLTPAILEALCTHEEFAHLKWVTLRSNPLSPEDLERLLKAPHLASLERLNLIECELGPRAAQRIAHSSGAARLRELFLDDCALADAGLAALADSPHLAQLERLDLGGNGLRSASALKALLRSPALTGLKALDLSRNQLGDDAARVIATSPRTANLTWLDLTGNPMSADARRTLERRSYLNRAARKHLWREAGLLR